jgi:hypothetical protein
MQWTHAVSQENTGLCLHPMPRYGPARKFDPNRPARMTPSPTEKEGVAKPQPLQPLALIPRDEQFQGIPVRIVLVDGKEMMPAVDIARALKINRGSVTRSLEDILLKKEIRECRVATSKGPQRMVCITSFGAIGLLYKLNAKNSDDEQIKEKILKFQEWATGLVQSEMQVQSKIVPVTEPSAPMAPARWSEAAIQCLDFAKALQLTNPQLDPGMVMAIGIREAERRTGQDLSAYKKLIPASPVAMQEKYITATQIGYIVGRTAKEVNKYLERMGYLYQSDDGTWYLTNAGAEYGKPFPGAFDSGHNGYYIKWRRGIIAASRMKENSPHRIPE